MRAAVFLDRDGTLVEEVPYLHDPGRVTLLPGAAALGGLAAAGYALVVVTNQAGVARGRYDEAAVEAVHRRLAELLAGVGVRLDAVLYCPHHPEGTVPGYARACRCRKPGPGMFSPCRSTQRVAAATRRQASFSGSTPSAISLAPDKQVASWQWHRSRHPPPRSQSRPRPREYPKRRRPPAPPC